MLLDDPRNDIYLHIDNKAEEIYNDLKGFKPQHSRFEMLEQRIDVRWGDVTIIEAEYILLEAALKNGPYAYYHILSGVDLPIKSQDYIHRFFDQNQGKEFVSFWTDERHEREALWRSSRYYLFTRDLKHQRRTIGYTIKSLCRNIFLALQKVSRYRRPNGGVVFKKGSNWISITEPLCKEFIAQKEWVMRRFKRTLCPDEIFAQTLLWNSAHMANVYCYEDPQVGNMRAIDWQRGSPYTWQNQDTAELLNSPMLFARKFSESQMAVVDDIYNHLSK